MSKRLEIYIDGASKGNPGPAGIGVIICRNGEVVKNISTYIGSATNNLAEYTALLYGLQEALLFKADEVRIFTDSELLCRQINKEYRVKNEGIKGLYEQAMCLISAFNDLTVEHIGREKNRGADKLANLAVKNAKKQTGSL